MSDKQNADDKYTFDDQEKQTSDSFIDLLAGEFN